MKMAFTTIALTWVLTSSAVGQESAFRSMSLDEALAAASKAGKSVFVDFYTTWCEPCVVLEKEVFQHERVVAWFNQNVVAIKIDCDEEPEVAEAYKVNRYPTSMFIGADGKELARIHGLIEWEEFIAEGTGILGGKSPLQRARAKFDRRGKEDFEARIDFAKKLAEQSEGESAVELLQWFYSDESADVSGILQARRRRVPDAIWNVGLSYPPAFDMLRARRKSITKELFDDFKGLASRQQIKEIVDINSLLNDPTASVALYESALNLGPGAEVLKLIRSLTLSDMVWQRRYDLVLAGVDVLLETQYTPPAEGGEADRGDAVVYDIYGYYEASLAQGLHDQARELQARAVKIKDVGRTYAQLARAGLNSGKPIKDNLTQARKAHELDPSFVTASILARALHAFDETEKACALLTASLAKYGTSRGGSARLKKLAAELRCGGLP